MDYPSLIPSTRAYTSGVYKTSRRDDLSGAVVRWLRGRVATGHRLTLNYELGSAAEVRQIINHYQQAQGGFIRFSIPAAVWCGSTNYPGSDVAGGLDWRYAGAPAVQDIGPSTFSVSVDLISVTVSLPARDIGTVAPGGTVAITVDNDPTPPTEPYGTWFRAFDQTVLISTAEQLEVPVRAFGLGPPIIATTSGQGLMPLAFNLRGSTNVAFTSGASAIELNQNNGRTVQLPIAPGGAALITGNPVSTVANLTIYTHLVPSATTQLVVPVGGEFTESQAPTGLANGVPSFSRLAEGAPTSLALPFSLTVGPLVDLLTRDSAQIEIPFTASVGPLVDLLTRDSAQIALPFLATVGGDADMPRLGGQALPVPLPINGETLVDFPSRASQAIAVEVPITLTDNPAYIDFTSSADDEDSSFDEGGVVQPLTIAFNVNADSLVDYTSRESQALDATFSATVGSDPDTPLRASQATPLPFSLTIGPDDDNPSRAGLAASAELSLAITDNPQYIDFTSGSTDEDAGFMESGVAQALAIAFDITVGSVLYPTSRDSLSVSMVYPITIGGNVDVPMVTSLSTSFTLDITLGTLTEPSFVDLTP